MEQSFGADNDYAMLIKSYGDAGTAPGRYSPAPYEGANKERVEGSSDEAHISTSLL